MGTFPLASITKSSQIPASAGLPGPGDMTTLSGCIPSMPSTVTASFLTTTMSGSMEPISW